MRIQNTLADGRSRPFLVVDPVARGAEWAFRITKDELEIRPIWRQKENRVKAHIPVCFLAYVVAHRLRSLQETTRNDLLVLDRDVADTSSILPTSVAIPAYPRQRLPFSTYRLGVASAYTLERDAIGKNVLRIKNLRPLSFPDNGR